MRVLQRLYSKTRVGVYALKIEGRVAWHGISVHNQRPFRLLVRVLTRTIWDGIPKANHGILNFSSTRRNTKCK